MTDHSELLAQPHERTPFPSGIPQSGTPPRNTVCVLVVEDNPVDALLVQEMLAEATSTRFEVACVDRLSAGLERLSQGGIDVVILDLGLPDSVGLETLDKMHAEAPGVAIVVQTGLDDEEVGIEAMQKGAQDYLVKGETDSALLVRTMRYAIERHALQAELAQRAEELQTSETRLRTVIERNADAMLIVDWNGTVRFANPAAEALFGADPSELVGQPFGLPLTQLEPVEIELTVGGGRRAVIEMRIAKIEWDGEPAYVASLRDVTERRRAAEALRNSEIRYRNLFEFSPIPLREEDLSEVKAHLDALRTSGVEDLNAYFGDNEDALVRCASLVKVANANRATLKLYAAQSKKELEERFAETFGAESHAGFRDELNAIAQGEATFQGETTARSLAHETRDIVMRWRVAAGHEETYSKVWVSIIDLTKRKQAERALRENEAQLIAARSIQERLLPDAPPPLPGFDVAGASFPAEITAGDYFDYIPMLNGCIGFAIGDVTGHGFGPALLMASTRAYLRLFAQNRRDLSDILSLTNAVLADETEDEHYVTVLLAQLDPQKKTLTHVSAGHTTGYVLDSRGRIKAHLESTDLPLAILPEARFPTGPPVALDLGDMVLLLTDGIPEAGGDAGAMFGDERTLEVVRANLDKPAAQIIQSMYEAICDFAPRRRPHDDATAVVVKVEGA